MDKVIREGAVRVGVDLVHVHGVPKAATPAIGARDVSREVSVAS